MYITTHYLAYVLKLNYLLGLERKKVVIPTTGSEIHFDLSMIFIAQI